jgi:hypothetical protein
MNILDDGKNHKGGGVGGRASHGRGDGYGFKPQGQNAPEIPKDEGCYSLFFSLDAWAERNLPFLIVPKASKAGKNAGLDSIENFHPTVKPLKLMAYLIALGSRPGDLIGDFAAGSGTTCVAAKLLGRKFIGIEKEEGYHEIAKARVENASLDVPVLKRAVADIRKHEESEEG